ncbi:hypothetical protein [Aneurinibacillus terranovensis]|uniref:hypothetical protein n=1 Tax=Aneurinibacillus terranovensis TaxID=278991 RepID=UPI0004233EC9|nr:hypothetical protein [Aneurinibacillus terranovensis]
MNTTFRYSSYLILTLLLVLYGLPRLPLLAQNPLAIAFSAVWLGFALLGIAAIIYQLLNKAGTDTIMLGKSMSQETQEKATVKAVQGSRTRF